MRDWITTTIGEFIDFNPSEKLQKNKIAKKIPMDKLGTFERKIKGFVFAEYQSGPKFRNNDTLVAKITPCLENGKTAFVNILDSEEVAFGSSEFIVLRNNKLSDAKFIYYLARSPYFREKAISCMEGTSGRKRVNETALKHLNIKVPPIETQQKIAKILSDIDNKIELLHQINDNLAKLAKTIYDYWFVQFDFPDENGKPYKSSGGKMVYNEVLKREIPQGWEVDNIFNVASIQYGFPFSTEFFNENKIGVPVIRIRDIKDNQISNFSTEEKIDSKYIIKKGEILIGMDGNFHINYWANDNCYLNQRVVKIQGIELSNIYLKEQIEPYIKTREKSISRTTVGHLSDKDLRSINIIIPNNLIMIKINSFYNNTLNKFIENLQQIQHLQSLRDWLLPMLMNGQVSVE